MFKNNSFDDIDVETLNTLIAKHIIVEEEDKYNFYNGMKVKYGILNHETERMDLFIMPTLACNFACSYCFEGEKDNCFISEEVTSNLINFIQKDGLKKISLTWYGGEPLLAFNKIKQIYDTIKSKVNIEIDSHSIITNGYLINKKVIDFFKESSMDKVQITLDGREERHNSLRYLRDSNIGTFNKIYSNILLLSESYPECKISIRVNIDKENKDDFVEIYSHFQSLAKRNIEVYPGIIKIDNSSCTGLCDNCFKMSEIYNLYSYFRQKGCKVDYFPHCHKHTCFINQLNSYVIGPSGEMYKCPEDANHKDRVIGNIAGSKIENQSLWGRYLIDSSQFERKECRDCLCFPLCDGGCGKMYLKNLYEGGTYSYCHPFKNRIMLEKAFLEEVSQVHSNKYETHNVLSIM